MLRKGIQFLFHCWHHAALVTNPVICDESEKDLRDNRIDGAIVSVVTLSAVDLGSNPD
jgi:hypothetical protein